MASVRRFEDLIVWQKARQLALEIHRVCEAGCGAGDFPLVNQLRKSAVSVVSNLAEGFERRGARCFTQFLGYSKASCAELRAQLYLAADVGWLTPEAFDRLMALATEVANLLGGVLRSQRRNP